MSVGQHLGAGELDRRGLAHVLHREVVGVGDVLEAGASVVGSAGSFGAVVAGPGWMEDPSGPDELEHAASGSARATASGSAWMRAAKPQHLYVLHFMRA